MIDKNWIDELKAKSDIVSVISKFIYLQRKGKNYWACCPFHGEKTPSFSINEQEQYYHCFGCGKSGSVLTFLMEHQKLTYIESIEYLAGLLGIQVPEQEETEEAKQFRQKMESAVNANRDAAKFYHSNLLSTNSQPFKDYITNRGLDINIIKKFGLGYSPDFDSLPVYLTKQGYDIKTLLFAGLVENKFNKNQDFLGGRLIFPIINIKSEVIGFGGRLLEKKDFAKYKNTAATPVFDKRKNLFAINLLKQLRQSESFNYVILVEGYMDVISLYQANIKNVVASMGTALTVEQCKLLKRFTNTIFVSYDGDAAGQAATMRSLDLLRAEGLEVKVVSMPDGLDPDDTIKRYGRDGYLALIDKALPLIDYKLKQISLKFSLDTPDSRSKYAKEAIKYLITLDAITRDAYISEVARLSSLSIESLTQVLVSDSAQNAKIAQKPTAERDSKQDTSSATEKSNIIAARFLLSAALQAKEYVQIARYREGFFTYNPHKIIYTYILDCIKQTKRPILGHLFDNQDLKEELDFLINAANNIPKALEQTYYEECIVNLSKDYKQTRMQAILAELSTTKDEQAKISLKNELRDLTRL